jgi:hypothetical protein
MNKLSDTYTTNFDIISEKPMTIIMHPNETTEANVKEAISSFEQLLKDNDEEGRKAKEEADRKLAAKIEELNKITIVSDKSPEDEEKSNIIMRVKTIALNKMGINPLKHTDYLTDGQRKKMIQKCDKILKSHTVDEITKKFNEIVVDEILSPKSDYTSYGVRVMNH